MSAQTQVNTIFARLLELDPATIYATMEPRDLRDMFLNARDELAGIIDALEYELGKIREKARNATYALEHAEIHHQDAQSFGWTDRDETAWSLIAKASCDLSDLIPVSA